LGFFLIFAQNITFNKSQLKIRIPKLYIIWTLRQFLLTYICTTNWEICYILKFFWLPRTPQSGYFRCWSRSCQNFIRQKELFLRSWNRVYF
jgi:hypothetical protein